MKITLHLAVWDSVSNRGSAVFSEHLTPLSANKKGMLHAKKRVCFQEETCSFNNVFLNDEYTSNAYDTDTCTQALDQLIFWE